MKWPRVPLATVAKLVRGVSFDTSETSTVAVDGKTPVLRAGNISEELNTESGLVWVPDARVSDEQLLQRGDIAIAMSSGSIAVVGKTARLRRPWRGAVGAFCAVIRPRSEPLGDYVSFWLRAPEFVAWRASQCIGANIKNLRKSELESVAVPLPAPREQRRIVELLEQADVLRHQRAEADAVAARILPSLFRKMFGDPTRNASGWPTENLLKICSPRQWPTISSRELLESGFPVYGANGRIGFYDSFNHEKPTVLITCRGATCGTINVCEPKSYVTGNAMSLDDPDERKITNEFLEWFLRVRGLRDTITGAAQPQITRANLAVVEVPTPPKPLVDTFTVKARDVRRIEAAQSDSRTKIGTLFQTMLHRAFTGELTARWREAHMKEFLAEMEQQARILDTNRATR